MRNGEEATSEVGGFPVELELLDIAGGPLRFWRAASLERFVDAEALLGADAPPEPPYWMHLWPGAMALARRVARSGEIGPGTRVLELGCGLGLPTIIAARRGCRAVATDWKREPLRILGRSAADNDIALSCLQMDWAAPGVRGGFDVCLGADVGYDQAAEASLVAALTALLRPGGVAWLADSVNTARTSLPDRLGAAGFVVSCQQQREIEESRPVWVRVIEARRG
jgi:predicted nicotinamide N-methyase